MSSKSYKTLAILVAGGGGKRFGGTTPKQFLPLAGKPLLVWALEAFQACSAIDGICLVIPEEQQASVAEWPQTYQLDKLQWIVAGGKERQDSVLAGFKAIPRADYVLVHDGARPLVTAEVIERVLAGAGDKGAAVPGLDVTETLKRVAEGGNVLTTVDRDEYATIQTPQGFRYTILAEALQEAVTDGFYGTDEAMLIERMGFPVSVVPGQRENIKVTTPDDLRFAELLLGSKGA